VKLLEAVALDILLDRGQIGLAAYPDPDINLVSKLLVTIEPPLDKLPPRDLAYSPSQCREIKNQR
jgi:hypothetical protein